MPNWPHIHHTLRLGSPHQACIGTRRYTLRQTTFLPPFFYSLLVRMVGATTLSHSDPWLWCYWLPFKVDVYQPGSSSSIAGLLATNRGGMARSSIGCWLVAAIGRLCHSLTNPSCDTLSIRQRQPPGPILLCSIA